MSNMARSDEIDELVSSVRNLVSYKDAAAAQKMTPQDPLILTAALRIDMPEPQPQAIEILSETTTNPAPVLNGGTVSGKPSLGATVAELGAAVNARTEDWEADGGESFDKAAWAASAFEPLQDDSAALDTPQPDAAPAADLPPVEPDDGVAGLDARIAEDIVAQHFADQIDEGALRAAVVRILREELAGEMGERITRNVRKLVRREINRVLVSRDLD